MDEDILFRIPKVHVHNLDRKWPTYSKKRDLTIEECSEFIKALLKRDCSDLDYDYLDRLNHVVEEFSHVLICMGMLQEYFGISQDMIDAEVRKKAGKYGFDISQYPERFQSERK